MDKLQSKASKVCEHEVDHEEGETMHFHHRSNTASSTSPKGREREREQHKRRLAQTNEKAFKVKKTISFNNINDGDHDLSDGDRDLSFHLSHGMARTYRVAC